LPPAAAGLYSFAMTGKMSPNLAAGYDEQYTDSLIEWRELGGKYKAANILDVCRGHAFHTLLECGAGEGSILKFLDQSGAFDELYALEISASGLAQIRRRNLPHLREARQFDGYAIPYADKYFDLVCCAHVLEHVEHPRLLLRELKRVSRYQVFEVPLDYSIGVDQQVGHFLAYGHINIYTPALFKFLINSEGFAVLAEKRSHTAPEATRYSWYRNLKLKPTLKRELMLQLDPLRQFLRRARRGRAWYQEFGFSAYTCLAEGVGELRIFDQA
jgi:ubiquinone/menaquinone biosynthesis C-methylase UbiE